MSIQLSAMSGDGKVVAIYGNTYYDGDNHRELYIHNVESTDSPVKVDLDASIGYVQTGPGLVINTDGSRIFFIVNDTEVSGNAFCMLNTLTHAVSKLLHTSPSDPVVESPQDIATDAAGDYLYFNESDNGYGTGDLWRIGTTGSAAPEMLLDASTIAHPSGGTGRFINAFDVSDDGQTIAFIINGWIDGDESSTTDKELFVKTDVGVRLLTDDEENAKTNVVLSGDASTIVYAEDNFWMVTTPSATVGSQTPIEPGYRSPGARPGISQDGSVIFAISSGSGYLIKTDGSGREMVMPKHIITSWTYIGVHLSDDGSRIFFKDSKYIYPNGWNNMTVGIFDRSLWTTVVPRITSVSYPSDMFEKLENNQHFEISIGVSDPQGDFTINDVKGLELLPNGYEDVSGEGPIQVSIYIDMISDTLYTTHGSRGSSWPSTAPVKVRFSVEDEDGNVGYADTVIERFKGNPALIIYLLN